jgi:hypothetical protein
MVAYVQWALGTRYARWWAPPVVAVFLVVALITWGQPLRPAKADLICLPIYKVQQGDSMSKIARGLDMPLEELMVYNAGRWSVNDPASWDLVLAGEVIYVGHPNCERPTNQPAVAPVAREAPAASGVPQEVLDFAEANYEAGFRGDKLITMTAINGGESGYDKQPCNGSNCDANMVNGKWGPSVTGYQIRTLNHPDRYPDGWYRNRAWLESDPMRNGAIATWHISGGGSNFRPWGAYTDGGYRPFIGVATEAARAVEAARE